jgi:hypothetical protein
LAHAGLVLAGWPAWLLPLVRSWRWPARLAAAYALGGVAVAIEATMLGVAGLPWSPAAVAIPSAAFLFLVPWAWARRGASMDGARAEARSRSVAGALSFTLAAASFGHLAVSLSTARSTSADYLLFWGVKAVVFARTRSIDPGLLTWYFFGHGQPFYPPLVPVVDALGVSAAGEMPWVLGPLVTALWFAATAILLHAILRAEVGRIAGPVIAFWMAALGVSLAFSFSGGNAEAPLLLYGSVAAALLLTEGPEPSAGRRWLAGLFLAGAVLCKVEGSVLAALWIAGTAFRDRLAARRGLLRGLAPLASAPLAAAGLWILFLLRYAIPVVYRGRGALFDVRWADAGYAAAAIARNLTAGSLGLPWLLPLAALAICVSRVELRRQLAGVFVLLGSFAFLIFVYMHDADRRAERAGWEIPRISQPALSLAILLAALACADAARVADKSRPLNTL